MLDIKYIRQFPEKIKKAVSAKNLDLDVGRLLEVDRQRVRLKTRLQDLQSQKNRNSKQFKEASTVEERQKMMEQGRQYARQIQEHQNHLKKSEREFHSLMLRVPAPASEEAPVGPDATFNQVVKTQGSPPGGDSLRSHTELLTQNGWADFLRLAQVCGSRSYGLKGKVVLLEEALLNWAARFLMRKGFELMSVPSFADHRAFEGSGHFPESEEDVYFIEKDRVYLTGTSEVILNSLYRGESLKESRLPLLLAGLSTCFRREAGSSGKDVRGLLRVHQFRKLEQFVVCRDSEEESLKWHRFLLQNAEEILQAFELPYRVVVNSTGDMGAGKYLMHDIECYLPSLSRYVETHSCSSMLQWQARRTGLRYRGEDKKMHYPHTLNNTAVAVPRLLAVFLENHQKPDGSIRIPGVLQEELKTDTLQAEKI